MATNIVVIGGSGAIGNAFTHQLWKLHPNANIHSFSQSINKDNINNIIYHRIDYNNESSIEEAAELASDKSLIDLVVVATGMLHDDEIMPEKSIRELSYKKLERIFRVNTFFPAIAAKHFIPKLKVDSRSIFAALSARVGSISDNELGGWYSYRSSKTALNMIIKTAAIETNKKNKMAAIVGLHPGTVDSNLSKPFQQNVPNEKLFTPEFSVTKLIEVMQKLTPEHSGKCFAWDGIEIKP